MGRVNKIKYLIKKGKMYERIVVINCRWFIFKFNVANAIDLKKKRRKRISGNVAMQTTRADKG